MPSPSFDPGDGCFPTGSGGEQVLQGTVAASHGMELEVLREHPMKSKGDVVRMRVSCKFEIVSRLYVCMCVCLYWLYFKLFAHVSNVSVHKDTLNT